MCISLHFYQELIPWGWGGNIKTQCTHRNRQEQTKRCLKRISWLSPIQLGCLTSKPQRCPCFRLPRPGWQWSLLLLVVLMGAGDWTQALRPAEQAVYQQSPSPKSLLSLRSLLCLKNYFHSKSLKVIVVLCPVIAITTNAYIILTLLFRFTRVIRDGDGKVTSR